VFQLLVGKGLVMRDGNDIKIQQVTKLHDIVKDQREAP
jgi:hypothetical protein